MRLRSYLDHLPHGQVKAFALEVGITPIYLSQLASRLGGREPSATLCLSIERATNGAVTRKDLRPDDFWKIWPDLAQPRAKRPRKADTSAPATQEQGA